jgi:hypothetical protein
MRLVMFALLSMASFAASADAVSMTDEDQAERACVAAARSFYTVAEAAHGRVSAVDTPAARTAYLAGFTYEWNHYLTSDTTPPPTQSLKPWLLGAWAHGVSMLHTMGDITGQSGVDFSANQRQWVLDAQAELNRHCMYALGRLEGEGRLLKVLGMVSAGSHGGTATQ